MTNTNCYAFENDHLGLKTLKKMALFRICVIILNVHNPRKTDDLYGGGQVYC